MRRDKEPVFAMSCELLGIFLMFVLAKKPLSGTMCFCFVIFGVFLSKSKECPGKRMKRWRGGVINHARPKGRYLSGKITPTILWFGFLERFSGCSMGISGF